MTEIGKHLLGRIVSPPDERDYVLENFLPRTVVSRAGLSDAELAQIATAELKKTTVSFAKWAATKYPDVAATHWWAAFDALAKIGAAPTPPPTPSGDVVWADAEAVLDQGNFGTCVGNGCAQWGNTLPVDDKFVEQDARDIYYEATILDGSPDDPDAPGGGQQGATVRSGVKVLRNRFRLAAYASTTSVDSVLAWLTQKGPVIFGTQWTDGMFSPDAHGYVQPTGAVAGGHCYLAVSNLVSEGAIGFLNSWGSGWGLEGYFKMKVADVATLLAQQGEAWTAVELPL